MIPLPKLLIQSFSRQLSFAAVEAELNAQLDAFVEHRGSLPDFIDGHQHIQHFPVIRNAMFSVYEQRLRQQGSYLRCVNRSLSCRQGIKTWVKTGVIQFSGASYFKNQVIKKHIPHNT